MAYEALIAVEAYAQKENKIITAMNWRQIEESEFYPIADWIKSNVDNENLAIVVVGEANTLEDGSEYFKLINRGLFIFNRLEWFQYINAGGKLVPTKPADLVGPEWIKYSKKYRSDPSYTSDINEF